MTVAAILHSKGNRVETIGPDATLPEIVDALDRHRIGALVVRDAQSPLLGIVSERDVVRALARHGAAALTQTAAAIMTSVLHTVSLATTSEAVMARMTESRIRHLPVMEHGELIGLISIGDVVKARLAQQDTEMASLRAYVAGS